MPETTPNGAYADLDSPVATVTAFLAALEALDIDRALSYVAPGIVYQNVPLPPARGKLAFERQMRAMTRFCTGFEARVRNIASDEGTVLTERVDVLKVGPWEWEFWVCGTFQVRDGKITVWRDYFDWTTLVVSGVRGVPRALRKILGGSFGPVGWARADRT